MAGETEEKEEEEGMVSLSSTRSVLRLDDTLLAETIVKVLRPPVAGEGGKEYKLRLPANLLMAGGFWRRPSNPLASVTKQQLAGQLHEEAMNAKPPLPSPLL